MPITDFILYSLSQLHSKRAGSRLTGSKEVQRCIIPASVVRISASLLCETAPLTRAPACLHFRSQPRVVATGGRGGGKAGRHSTNSPDVRGSLGNAREAQTELLADGPQHPAGTSSICVSEDLRKLRSQGQSCGWRVRGVCACRLFKKCIEMVQKASSHKVKFITESLTLCRSTLPFSCLERLTATDSTT